MIIGIDLGTTNSLCAIWLEGEAVLIPNPHGHKLTPSAVAMDDDGHVVVGLGARELLATRSQSAAASFKRYMGTTKEIDLAGRAFRPEELSALVLKSLKADAEHYLNETITEAVITVPAYFNDKQREATRIAGELAGLKVERLLNEPTAAALAYGLHQRQRESKFLVFDLGGGTFDVSILEIFEGVMEVHASAGDNHLGGDDFNSILAEYFLQHVKTEYGIREKDILESHRALLRTQVEQVKRILTTRDTAEIKIVHRNKEIIVPIDSETFENLSSNLLTRLRKPLDRALRDADLLASDLDEIVLVGGATRKPMIRKLVARMFGRLPSATINPDEVVACGAAVQAGLKARDAALSEVVITDVCPFTLGIEIAKQVGADEHQPGFYQPIIERNTVIPTSRVEMFSPIDEFQDRVQIKVYQGESPMVKDNIYLGSFQLPIPKGDARKESFDVRFTYDINGLLEVDAKVRSTEVNRSIVIEEKPGTLSKEEINARLKALGNLKIHPRDQSENKALISRAERMYEENLGDRRDNITHNLAKFLGILDRQDVNEIRHARIMFSEFLDEIEGETYL